MPTSEKVGETFGISGEKEKQNMHRTRYSISIHIVTLILGILVDIPFARCFSPAFENPMADSDFEYDSEPQEAGINRFYTAEYKRLPFYDFGLGKRSAMDKRNEASKEYDDYFYNGEEEGVPELDLYNDENMQTLLEKRQTPYSFGLGKRGNRYDFGLGKRINRYDFGLGKRGNRYDFGLGKRVNRYDFGLGKRSLSALRRDKVYNMGLGKRNVRMYGFGLGKRPYGSSPVASRFNFGLGKRSDDFDEISQNQITKREVQMTEAGHHSDSAGTETIEPSSGKDNRTKEWESRETVNDLEKPRLSKRSPNGFSHGSGNNAKYRNSVGFSRQFRKPLYSFGLGKRTSSYSFPSTDLNLSNN